MSETDYIPFGKEWKEEMGKHPKAFIVDRLANVSKRLKEMEELKTDIIAYIEEMAVTVDQEWGDGDCYNIEDCRKNDEKDRSVLLYDRVNNTI